MATLHRGHLFHLAGDGSLDDAGPALREHRDGGLLVDDTFGRILASGDLTGLEIPPGTRTVDHRGAFLVPGFVDTHLHFPQVFVQHAGCGADLLPWLEREVFPAEARLADRALAADAARAFCDALIRAGTTCSLIFGSQFPVAQEALVAELRRRGLRAILGRTTMVRGPAAAAPLLTDEATAVRLARDEIAAWHPGPAERDRALLHAALIPRFALSVTPRTLHAFGEILEEHAGAGLYFTTHLGEDATPEHGEIASVLRDYGVPRYLDVYDGRFLPGGREGGRSLLGPRSLFAHAVHCDDGEYHRLAESGSAIAHCPVSQAWLGTGTMPWRRVRTAGVKLALGTDVGAGDVWGLPEVLNAAFKAHRNRPPPDRAVLDAPALLHLATLGGAQALALSHRIGNFDAGKDADFVVISAGHDPLLARRLEAAPASSPATRLFLLLLGAGRGSVRRSYVQGRELAPAS